MTITGLPRAAGRQQGITLLIALIALIAISLGGIALMRMVDAGILITGNLAFKQTASQAGDAGTEAAIEWLDSHGGQLDNDVAASGYYAAWRSGCDLLGDRTGTATDDVVWNAGGTGKANCGMVAATVPANRLPDGYSATYVINRMCDSEGSPSDTTVSCPAFVTRTGGAGSTKSGGSYGQLPITGTTQQYYRVTTRVTGPRNTESFVQAVIGY